MRRPIVNIILRRAIVLFFILVLSRITLFAQFDTIWHEGFNNADGLDVLWFIDTSKCDLSVSGGHFEVNNGVFSSYYLDSIAIWKTKNFFIGDKTSVGIKLQINSVNTEIDDSLQIFYSINDNEPVLMSGGEFTGQFAPLDFYTCYGEGIAGDSIKLIVRVHNNDADDSIRFDNVLIFSNKPLEISGKDTVCSLATNEIYTIQKQNEHNYWWDTEFGSIQGANTNDTVTINWFSEINDGRLIVYDTTSTFNCPFSDTLKIKIGDFDPPTITQLPNDTLYLTDSCLIVIPNYLSLINVSDNCGGILSQSQIPSADTILNPSKYKHNAIIPILITIIDDSYNDLETRDTIDVLILDTIPPEITNYGLDSIELFTLSSSCSSTSTDINKIRLYDCSNFDTTYTMTGSTSGSGSGFVTNQPFNIGTTNVKYVFTDIAGNKDSITIVVVVQDNVPPSIICPSDTVVGNDGTDCSAIVNNIDLQGASDNCTDSTSLMIKHVLSSNTNDTIIGYASGTQFNIDTTTVTYIVTDAAGNIAIDSFLVIVNDSIPPNISLQGGDTVLLQNDVNQCHSSIDIDTAIINDNCDASPSISGVRDDTLELNAPYPLGETTITWTAIDVYGNDSIAEQLVIVSDTSKPVFIKIPGDINVTTDADVCTAEINFGRTILDATDNCSIDSLWNNNSNDSDTILTFSIGTTILQWFVVDNAGNTNTLSLEVTVDDLQKPKFTPPKDTTINFGSGTDSTDLGYPTNLNDNCTDAANIIISHTDNIVSGTCPVIDTLKRTWHVIDESLNDSIWIQNIVRIDTSAPDINIQNIIVTLPEATGLDTISYLDIDFGTKDSTNFTMWLSDSTFDCSYIGDTTIIFYAKDQCGNIDSTEFTVTVEYQTDPDINILPQSDTICSGGTTAIDLDGNLWMNFYWEVSENSDITGFFEGTDSIGGTMAQTLNNLSNDSRYIDYIITPRVYSKCLLTDKKDTIRVWVEPVPKVNPIILIDTICNGGMANIKLETPTNPTDSIRFDVIVSDISSFIIGDNNHSRIEPNDSIYQTLTNISTEIQYVDYIITPFLLNNEGSEVCKSTDNNDTVRIFINPSPDLDVELTTANTICNLSNIQLEVTSLNPTIGGSAFYFLDVDTIPETMEGIKADGNYSLDDIINDIPKNLTDSVQTITYRFTPWFDNMDSQAKSCEGVEDTSITVYINPTPKISVGVSDTVICNDATITFSIDSLVQSTGSIRYSLNVEYPANVTGDLFDGNFNVQNISDQINNNTNQVQAVTYNFTPFIEDAYGTTDCNNGLDTTITVYVNPTPEISVFISDTIFCDLDEVQFNLNSLNGNVIGDKIISLETNYISGAVDGLQTSSEYNLNSDSISFTNQLDNLTDSFQIIEYTFKANIKNPRTDLTYCDNGMDTTIRIYVNPTPTIEVQINDTIYCDNSNVNFDITNTTGKIKGDLFYELKINFNSDSITNTKAQDHYIVDTDITDSLTNNSFEYQIVNYQFIPKIRDDRPGKGGVMKCDGDSTDINIYVNPTPRISVAANDTIYCNNSPVEFLINSVTTNVLGNLEFDIEAIPSGTISGTSDGEINHGFYNFNDTLTNETTDLQYVDYTLTPKINNVPSSSQTSCDDGIPATLRIYITPTFETEAISLRDTNIIGGWDVRCYGDKTAQASVKTIGGYVSVEGYTEDDVSYEWNKVGGDNYNTKTITQLGSGIYNVTATDKIGCVAISSIELSEPDLLIAGIDTITELKCVGDNNGSLRANPSGGTKSYSILWKRLETNSDTLYTAIIDSLFEGRYELYVTDTNQCTAYNSARLDPAIQIQVTSTDPDVLKGPPPSPLKGYHIACFGGTMDSTIFYGKGAYNYNLIYPNGDTLNFDTQLTTVKDLPAGYYELNVTDINNCHAVYPFNLLQPEPVKIGNVEISGNETFNISCYGEKDGYIHLNDITGGIDYGDSTYIYEWKNPQFDPLSQYLTGLIQNEVYQNNLIAGTYYVTVNNGICELKDTFILTQPEELIVEDTIKNYSGGFNVSCFGMTDGEIKVKAYGGYISTGSYNYSWSNGSSDTIISGLAANNYSLTVKDEINCTTKKSYTLVQPTEMDIDYNLSDNSGFNISCFDGQDGTIEIIPSGGDSTTYSYQWKTLSGGGISETARNQYGLTAGSYRVILTDDNACVDSATIELDEPDKLTILDIAKEDVSCDGKQKGFAEVIDAGGAGSHSYLWSSGDTTKRIEGLDVLFLTVTVTDDNGCKTDDSIKIEKTDSLDIELIPVEQYAGDEVISCPGASDGEIIAHVTYGQKPYTYEWSTGSKDSIITDLSQGWYEIKIIDHLQCSGTQSIFIQDPDSINPKFNITNVTCYNFNDGSVQLEISGGAEPYSFNWLDKEITSTPTYSGLKAGTYSITIIDANNCIKDTIFEVQQPTPLSMDYEIEKPFCPDMKDGSIIAIANGGIPGYTYSWNTGSNSDFIENINENNYIITVTDNNNCEKIDTFFLQAEHDVCLQVPTAFTPNGDGINDRWEIVLSSDNEFIDEPKLGDIYPDVTVEIYNRWGELVFISEDGYRKEWDGKNIRNGKDLPIDSYHYIIDFGDGRTKTGNVTIIR